jgi:hypothetical protein
VYSEAFSDLCRNDYENFGKLCRASDYADHEAHYWELLRKAATGTTTTTVAYDYDKRGAPSAPRLRQVRFCAGLGQVRPRRRSRVCLSAPSAPLHAQATRECASAPVGSQLYSLVRFCAILYVGFKVMAGVDNRSHAGPSEPTHRTVST